MDHLIRIMYDLYVGDKNNDGVFDDETYGELTGKLVELEDMIILITKTNYSDWVDQSIRCNRPTCHFDKIPITLTIHSYSKS